MRIFNVRNLVHPTSNSVLVIQSASFSRIWTTKGKKKLNEFLADMGLPLMQCNQMFGSMDMEIRKDVCNWIEVKFVGQNAALPNLIKPQNPMQLSPINFYFVYNSPTTHR